MMMKGLVHGYMKPHEAEIQLGDVVSDRLAVTTCWVNKPYDSFGFAEIHYESSPSAFLEVYPVPEATNEIILASDGAVVSPNGAYGPSRVSDMLAAIADLKSIDPYCLDCCPYWRGSLPESQYFDDTSLIVLRKK